jgi:predicted glycosyltransferase
VIDDSWRERRAGALLAAWRACMPDAVVLELFPFGRRQMRFELLPLLEAVRADCRRAIIFSSVRDILGAQKSAQRQEETIDLVERYFDQVLVHGDPGVIGFERSFPMAGRIVQRIAYTGYVVDPPAPSASRAGAGEVVVSAGGGAVGARLLEAAIRARPLTSLRERCWRILAGNNLAQTEFDATACLVAAQSGIMLERSRADFTSLLANCELSVSQAGYNTLMETVCVGARAVVVPFAGGHETEQTLRAHCFARRGLVEVVDEAALTPEALAAAIERAMLKPRPAPGAIDLLGARKSAALIARRARERRA